MRVRCTALKRPSAGAFTYAHTNTQGSVFVDTCANTHANTQI